MSKKLLTEWDRRAGRVANKIDRTNFLRSPGIKVFDGYPDVMIAIGIDGYLNHAWSRRQVELLRERLSARGRDGGTELGFGTSDDGRTWVMAVVGHGDNHGDVDWLCGLNADCWLDAYKAELDTHEAEAAHVD